LKRRPDLVLRDVLNGMVSMEAAERDYSVVIDPRQMRVDMEATERLRSGKTDAA